MECQWKVIDGNVREEGPRDGAVERTHRRAFLRQLLVSSGVWCAFFQQGLCLGTPTVLIPQLRREANSSAAVSDLEASWLSAGYCYFGIPWNILLPVLVHFIGRKLTFTFINVATLASFIVLYCSRSVTHILISEGIQGVMIGSVPVLVLIIAECTAPKYRGSFLSIKAASCYWGIWASNAIGTFFHWKNIVILGIVCSVYNIVTVIVWPESPYWLASKGRFRECREQYRWLHGTGQEEELALETLINCGRKKLNKNTEAETKLQWVAKKIRSKEFYKPIALCYTIIIMFQCTGKLVFAVYAIDLIKNITSSESAAYAGMLVLDGVTVLGMYAGCWLSRYLRRRTLFFTGQFIGTTFLFVISLYLYIIKLSVVTENHYVSIVLLMIFSMSISCGPIVLSGTLYSEIMPLRFRNVATAMVATAATFTTATALMVAPAVYAQFQLSGGFLLHGVSSLIFAIILFKYLPETKNKTLHEIEDYFKSESTTNDGNKALMPDTN